jgi:hypothetical protein
MTVFRYASSASQSLIGVSCQSLVGEPIHSRNYVWSQLLYKLFLGLVPKPSSGMPQILGGSVVHLGRRSWARYDSRRPSH